MTLSLDEVRNVRFPMARKPNEDGYRASAVDNFMDKLEVSYAELLEEIEHLRGQGGGGGGGAPAVSPDEVNSLRSQLEGARGDITRMGDELSQLRSARMALETANNQLRQDNERLSGEANRLRHQLDELRASGDRSTTGEQQLQGENEELHRQIEGLRAHLNEAQQQLAAAEQARLAAEQRSQQAPEWVRPLGPTAAETTAQLGVVDDGVRRIVVSTSAEASPAVVRLVELSTQQAETLIEDAQGEAQRRVDEASGQAERLTAEARVRAQQLEHETRQNADRILAEARSRADRLDSEVRQRRSELFSSLEAQRDQLADLVNQLRDYEENYRRTFNGFLQSQVEQLGRTSLQPANRPDVDAMYGVGDVRVSTPRLDALVEESRRELG